MKVAVKRFAFACCIVLLSIPHGAAASPANADAAVVTTLAGSGAMGIADGDAARATFQLPDGIAAGSDGTVYVADAASQRIRAIAAGKVTTIAGSGAPGALGFGVAPGYRDGPALSAQFDRPRGIAVARDGAIYIADSGNAAIRKVQNGVVTTVVGKPVASARGVDGDATVARLVRPMSLAFDVSGRLWIADFGGGLRCWDHGKLVTEKLVPDATYALSVSVQPDDGTVLVAAINFVAEFDSKTGNVVTYYNDAATSDFNAPIGTANQIVGIGNGQALFTDDIESDVRYVRFALPPFVDSPFSTVVAGGPFERHSDDVGFADGAGSAARFAQPSGLVVAGNRAIVADTGNRRIRSFTLPQFRTPEVGRNSQYRYDSSHYEVALVGSSWEWYDSHDGDSMCAHVEQQLDASRKLTKPARCHTVRIDAGLIPPSEDYIAANLAFRHVDEIVMSVEPIMALFMNPTEPDRSVGEFRSSIVDLLAAIKPSKAHFTLFWQNFEWTVSNREDLRESEIRPAALGTFDPDAFATALRPKAVAMFRALDDLGIGQCDEYDRTLAYEQSGGAALFLPDNGHPTARGNGFFGTILGDCLAQRLPAAPETKR